MQPESSSEFDADPRRDRDEAGSDSLDQYPTPNLEETVEFDFASSVPRLDSRLQSSVAGEIEDRHLVFGSQPGIQEEILRGLRIRLRAAAIVLLLGFVVFLIRDLLVELALPDPFHVLMTTAMAFVVFSLSHWRDMSAFCLRSLELVLFFLPAFYFSYLCISELVQAANDGDEVLAMAIVKTTVMSFFALIMTYGMFVPSTWKRALAVTGSLAFILPITMITVRVVYPVVDETLTSVMNVMHVTNNALLLLLGASASVVAAHTFHRLRTEAFEAKQLGQYQLQRLIGRGGMGEVYLAEHHFLRRPCAIKILRGDRTIDPDTLARFEREVRLTSRLTHPNTVQIFDYGRDESGTFFYVMEYLPGMTLQELVDRFGRLPAERVAFLIIQISEALEEAEKQGLVHRDIKPSNILVTQRGGRHDVAKLVDFGLAKPIEPSSELHLSRVGQISGSPLYLSPEQAVGKDPDTRSDLYSLAAVTYFALSGKPPFDHGNPMAVMVAHARDEPTPLRELRPDLPDDLCRVVSQCLKKEPGDRVQSAAELTEALRACACANDWCFAQAEKWWATRSHAQVVEHDGQTATPTEPTLPVIGDG